MARTAHSKIPCPSLHTCIYCLRQMDQSCFNLEHVLSEAFGEFTPDLKLQWTVCRECNQYFGDRLEVFFARGGFEGMLRYRAGIAEPKKPQVRLRYVDLAFPEDGSDWASVRLELVVENGAQRVIVPPQIAFLDPMTNRWLHCTCREIAARLSERPDLKCSQKRIFANSQEESQSVLSALKDCGIEFKKIGDLAAPSSLDAGGTVLVEVTITIDQLIRRCIAEYSFNYLALELGSDFVLSKDFEVIRNFIRHGVEPPYPIVVPSFAPILHRDSPELRQTDGHLLTLSWNSVDLLGNVSLFNYLSYTVLLSRGFCGVWRPIRCGIHFTLESNDR